MTAPPDNGNPGGGALCDTGDDGVCAFGVTACDIASGAPICVPDNTPSDELCDGLDNDCDGQVDNGALWSDLGTVCLVGEGICQRAGVVTCDVSNPDGPGVCSAVAGASETEVCDGLDNNCDGNVDELSAWSNKGTSCTAGIGACERAGVFVCNASNRGGPTVCSAVPAAEGTETCNGIDDDCDGAIDNDLSSPLCPLQAGVCLGSTQTCAGAGGYLSCDAGNYGGDYEVTEVTCDGLDNDCDGTPDNVDLDGDGYISEACGGNDCNDRNPLVYPGATEICGDGEDNDCNDVVDDLDGDDDGYISAACGGLDCNDTTEFAQPGLDEVCGDSLDNDCDGSIDNKDADDDGFVDEACGGFDCDDSLAIIAPGAPEICDGFDNDCNTLIDDKDEDFDGFIDDDPLCGGLDCDDDNAQRNPGKLEICGDAIDNDCDGTAENRDLDGDGAIDEACGGGDCDDVNALINSDASETCGDAAGQRLQRHHR